MRKFELLVVVLVVVLVLVLDESWTFSVDAAGVGSTATCCAGAVIGAIAIDVDVAVAKDSEDTENEDDEDDFALLMDTNFGLKIGGGGSIVDSGICMFPCAVEIDIDVDIARSALTMLRYVTVCYSAIQAVPAPSPSVICCTRGRMANK